jgi:hypothetical protein
LPCLVCIVVSTVLIALFVDPRLANAAAPTISLTAPATPATETDQSSITLSGSATSDAGLNSVRWVNQFEQRGTGTSSGSAQSTWSVANIPLRPGVNLVTVTVVDGANRGASTHLTINSSARRQLAAASSERQPLSSASPSLACSSASSGLKSSALR